MAVAQILLILSFLILFYFSRIVWVKIIKDEELKIELHLPLLALCLTTDKKGKKKTEQKDKLDVLSYFRIATNTLSTVKKCTVTIHKIHLPFKDKQITPSSLLKSFGAQGLIYSAISHLKAKISRLLIDDNAIISSPDIAKTHFYFTIKLRLFQLIYALLTFIRGVYKEKRSRRKKYVGE